MLHRMAREKIVVLHNINEYQERIAKLKTQFNLGKKCARSGFTERDLINQVEKTMSYDTCKCRKNILKILVDCIALNSTRKIFSLALNKKNSL